MTYPIPEHETWKIIDSSKITDSYECMRKYFFMHMLGWRSTRPNNHLVFGDAIHASMEYLLLNGYGVEQVVDAEELFYAIYRKDFPEETDELFTPKTPFRAVKMLSEYVQKYESDLQEFDVLYTEIAGTVALDDTTTVAFRMDSICKGEKYFSLEHKTRQGPFNNQWAMQWPLATAPGTYTHALNCLYPPSEVAGVITNGLFFKKTKAPLFEFKRIPVYKDKDQMQVWMQSTINQVDEIKHQMKVLEVCSDKDHVLDAFPMNPTACGNYFGCGFHDYCIAWPNPLQRCARPPLGYTVKFWNPFDKPFKSKMEL